MPFGLVVQLVRNICEKGFETSKERFVITIFQFINEFSNLKSLIVILHWSVEWNKKIDESITYFIIGKIQ